MFLLQCRYSCGITMKRFNLARNVVWLNALVNNTLFKCMSVATSNVCLQQRQVYVCSNVKCMSVATSSVCLQQRQMYVCSNVEYCVGLDVFTTWQCTFHLPYGLYRHIEVVAEVWVVYPGTSLFCFWFVLNILVHFDPYQQCIVTFLNKLCSFKVTELKNTHRI